MNLEVLRKPVLGHVVSMHNAGNGCWNAVIRDKDGRIIDALTEPNEGEVLRKATAVIEEHVFGRK